MKGCENNNSLFDVAQGSYLGAELCELVDHFVLNWLNDILKQKMLGYTEITPCLTVLVSK